MKVSTIAKIGVVFSVLGILSSVVAHNSTLLALNAISGLVNYFSMVYWERVENESNSSQ